MGDPGPAVMGEVLPWLGDVTLRASLPLLLAALVSPLLRRRPARVRQGLWTLALGAALLVPLFSWLPGVHLPLGLELRPAPEAAVEGSPEAGPLSGPARAAGPATGTSPRVADPGARDPRGALDPRPRPLRVSPPVLPSTSLSGVLVVLWLALGGLALVRLAHGLVVLRRLARAARPCDDPRARALLARLGARLALPARTELRVSDAVATPLAFGWLRPVVLLPPAAAGWSDERLEVVLAHELVHVHHRDALVQLAARATRAFYWFHPLVRLACRRLAVERERSCDEAVLALGATPSVYARHLLAIALATRGERRFGGAALAMAHRTQLEGRLMSILEDDPRRGRRGALLLAPLTAAMLAASGVALAARTLPQEERPAPVEPPGRVPVEPAGEPAGHPPRDPHAAPREPAPEPRHKYSYHVYRGAGDDEGLRIAGRMRGLEPQGEPVWRIAPDVQALFREAQPILEELRPFEAQLDAIRAEMEPTERKLEALHAEMEPFHARLDALHAEMEPLHELQSGIHAEMEPVHERMEALHREMEGYHRRQEKLHERLEPFHAEQEEIHRQMEGVHERMEQLHRELEPLHERVEELHEAMEPLHEELARLKPTNARWQRIQDQLDGYRRQVDRERERMEPIREKLERVHEELEPFHRALERVHERMQPVHRLLEEAHRALEPFHARLETLHEELAPFHRRLETHHAALEPFHERREAIQREMEPLHERLEALHEVLEPYHERMEPIHDAMEPFWDRLEPIWERLEDVLAADLRRQWEEAVEARSFADPRVRGLLLDETERLTGAIGWGWAVSREPWHVRLHASRRSLARALARTADGLLEERGWTPSGADAQALGAAIESFADTLPRVRYRL